VCGISQQEGDRWQAIAKKVFDALCEKISRDIVELARNANAELWRSGWSTFSNVLYSDYCSQPV